MKTVNQKRLKVFLKMGFVKVVRWLSKNFATTAFKCRCNKRHRKISSNDNSKVSESILQIARLAGRNGDDWVFNTKNSEMAF